MKLERKYLDTEKKELVQTFIASGESMSHWCRERNLPHSTFYGWIKKYGKVLSKDFIEIKATSTPKSRRNNELSPTIKRNTTLVIESRNFKIGVETNVDTTLLKTVLKVVATLDV